MLARKRANILILQKGKKVFANPSSFAGQEQLCFGGVQAAPELPKEPSELLWAHTSMLHAVLFLREAAKLREGANITIQNPSRNQAVLWGGEDSLPRNQSSAMPSLPCG